MPKTVEAPSLEQVIAGINRDYGQGAAQLLGQREVVPVPVISTGALSLDQALGVGGLPQGRVIEIYGPESSGKTTVALQVMANAQKLGGRVAMIDAEHALDAAYARNLGLNLDDLVLNQPDSAEQGLQIADRLVSSGHLSVIVIDSVAALVPRAEIEGEIGDSHVGLQARLMGQTLRKLTPKLAANNTMCIFINQLREKIGVMFGSPETTTGGKALKFYASVRLDVRRIQTVKDGTEATANKTRVKVVKNKVAPPLKQAEFEIEFGRGVNVEGEIVDLAVEHGIFKKSGGHHTLPGVEGTINGRANVIAFLRDNPELRDELLAQVRTAVGL